MCLTCDFHFSDAVCENPIRICNSVWNFVNYHRSTENILVTHSRKSFAFHPCEVCQDLEHKVCGLSILCSSGVFNFILML